MRNTAGREPVSAGSAPSIPRLRLGPVPSGRTLLGGGWWPRSADPVAELPGLIRAIDDHRGRVTRLMLGPAGWDSQPRWLGSAGRAVPLDWFPGQPAGLLTAFCTGDRVDLLIIPPGSAEAGALGAMELAAQASLARVPDILATLTSPAQPTGTELELSAWESEGGRLASLTDADLMTAVDAAREPVQIPAQASLSVLSRSACTIARLEGDLDIATVPALRERLLGVLSPGVRLLIIDLAQVSFCDVSGLGVLIGTQRRATARGITVRLAAPCPQVARLLRISGLDHRFTICATLADALPTQWHGPPNAMSAQPAEAAQVHSMTPVPPGTPGRRGQDEVA